MNVTDRLAAERRARLAAEQLLDTTSAALIEANRKLARQAQDLADGLADQRSLLEQARAAVSPPDADGPGPQGGIAPQHPLWEVIRLLPTAVALFDPDQRLTAANGAWVALFAPGAGPAQDPSQGLVLPDLVARLAGQGLRSEESVTLDALVASLGSGRVLPPALLTHPDGRVVEVVMRRSERGDVIWLAHDITAWRTREAELQTACARAETANRSKSAFLSTMSHELRTPMSGVIAMIEMLGETALSEEQRGYLNTIRSSGEALMAVINDVLEVSRLDAAPDALPQAPFDLELMVHDVVGLFAPVARQKTLALHVDYDLSLPARFLGDTTRLRQVLTNLMGNAVKFTTSGHVVVGVSGVAQGSESWAVTLSVADTGMGIAPARQAQLLDPLAGAPGLGLPIARQLVEMMEGRITLRSVPGEGSVFAVELTLTEAEPFDNRAGCLAGPGARVLLIAGSVTDRHILRHQLGHLGLSVQGVPDLAAAQPLIRQGGLRAVVMLTDAPERAQELAALMVRTGAETPAVVIAAAARPGHGAIMPTPPVEVLLRPYLRSDLIRALSQRPRTALPGPARPETPVVPARRRMRVLAAEDNRTNRLVIAAMLKALEIDLSFATDGQEAVAAFGAQQPDLIFMDISMPQMDGKQATAAIRDLERGAHVPIIALTAHALRGDKEDILAAGLDHYMTKPLRRADLVAQVLRHCPPDCLPPGRGPMAEAG